MEETKTETPMGSQRSKNLLQQSKPIGSWARLGSCTVCSESDLGSILGGTAD